MILAASRTLLAAAFAFFVAAGAFANTDPSSVVTLIVPYATGGGFDVGARRIQPELAKGLEKTVIVENVTGASGSIAAQRVLNADPSRLTILVGSPGEVVLPPLTLHTVRYKPQDFRLVAMLSTGTFVLLARPDLPAKNLQELIEKAKRAGDKPLTYGSAGTGSIYHMIGAEFGKRLGVPTTHVPYRGISPLLQDMMSGLIDIAFQPMTPSIVQLAQSGKIKVLAVLAHNRIPALPEAPSADEIPQLKDFHHYTIWSGLFVPSSFPKDVAAKIGKAANNVVATKAYRDWVAERGSSAGEVMTLEQAATFYERETKRFEDLARDINLIKE